MSDAAVTRSAVVEMKDERRAMHEGYVFLDEKCLLLAGEILRQLGRHAQLQRGWLEQERAAVAALRAAAGRHGIDGLQLQPPERLADARVVATRRSLMGVALLDDARLEARRGAAEPAVDASPEAEACRRAHARLLDASAALAAVGANLERLSHEYRRSLRRARALQDVMLPEIERRLYAAENRLEEVEQEDAVFMRQGAKR